MCEFCGCETVRLVEHPLQQGKRKGKALGVRVKAAPVEPKSSAPLTADSRYSAAPARKELPAEYV